jgi:hypothetical protein
MRLPGLRELSSEAKVAYGTMAKTVARLARSGAITARRKAGLILHSRPTFERRSAPPLVAAQPRWQETRTRLYKDLLDGVHPADGVLLAKELKRRYGVCHATVSAALGDLGRRGVLVRKGRGYVRPQRWSAGSSIALICWGDPEDGVAFPSTRTRWHLRALEAECSRVGVDLLVWPMGLDGSIWALRDGRDPLGDRDPLRPCLGFIVWSMPVPYASLARTYARLGRTGRPVAILDEAERSVREQLGAQRRTRVFSMAVSTLGGRAVGKYLLELGHRRIAYISITSTRTDIASDNRFVGLAQAINDAGFSDRASAHALEDRSDTGALERQAEALRGEVTSAITTRLARTAHSSLATTFSRMLTLDITSALRWEALSSDLERMLCQVARDTSVTAWVCYNDQLALQCVDYLRTHGVRVPEDVSVIGFDDSFEASLNGLSSYSFGGAAYMKAMVGFLLDPTSSLYRTEPGRPVEIDGVVVARATSARARS